MIVEPNGDLKFPDMQHVLNWPGSFKKDFNVRGTDEPMIQELLDFDPPSKLESKPASAHRDTDPQLPDNQIKPCQQGGAASAPNTDSARCNDSKRARDESADELSKGRPFPFHIFTMTYGVHQCFGSHEEASNFLLNCARAIQRHQKFPDYDSFAAAFRSIQQQKQGPIYTTPSGKGPADLMPLATAKPPAKRRAIIHKSASTKRQQLMPGAPAPSPKCPAPKKAPTSNSATAPLKKFTQPTLTSLFKTESINSKLSSAKPLLKSKLCVAIIPRKTVPPPSTNNEEAARPMQKEDTPLVPPPPQQNNPASPENSAPPPDDSDSSITYLSMGDSEDDMSPSCPGLPQADSFISETSDPHMDSDSEYLPSPQPTTEDDPSDNDGNGSVLPHSDSIDRDWHLSDEASA